MNIQKSLSALYYLGMGLVFVGTLMSLAQLQKAPWIFTIGVVPILGIRFYNRAVCSKERQRINSILVVSALFLAMASFVMLTGRNYWIIAVLIAASLDTYASFRK